MVIKFFTINKYFLNKYRQLSRRNPAVSILQRVAKTLPPMPQLPTDIFRQCLPLLLQMEYICRYLTESFEIFTTHATIIDEYSVSNYRWIYRRNDSIGKVHVEIFFFACFSVFNIVGVPRCLVFFITDRINEGIGNFWQMYSVGEAARKKFTDGLRASHRRNESIGKIV